MDETKTAYQREILENRLRKRDRHLRKWARRAGTDAYRLYDRDIPEIPLTLDRYGDAVSGALYEREYSTAFAAGESQTEGWLSAMAAAISRALDIPPERIFLKRRKRLDHHQGARRRRETQYEKLGDWAFVRDIHEGGLRFRVNLSDYVDTGFFPDRRILREMVRAGAAGKRVLNLFCYTAAFSVYAASGGAALVDSVDLSNTYLNWGALNLRLNGFAAESIPAEAALRPAESRPVFPSGISRPCRMIRADALSFLNNAARRGCSWDAIILDPPTFSNSKKMSATLDIRRDHRILITQALGLLRRGGVLWFSTNARHFHLDAADLLEQCRESFPGLRLRDLSAETAAPDFRASGNPHCYCFTRA
ncbi:MAG: class I SAM-dependent methyltransferase [Treponema sp.]|jgi:23S rRNA G2069 N7-methylase RlmK/C1962 C5-methylase RlmI|nr:class I SAM-dependent methyltransferase [Treponema sp.]